MHYSVLIRDPCQARSHGTTAAQLAEKPAGGWEPVPAGTCAIGSHGNAIGSNTVDSNAIRRNASLHTDRPAGGRSYHPQQWPGKYQRCAGDDGDPAPERSLCNSGYFDPADGVNTNIQFCMAERDPDNNPTNGITRDVSSYTVMGGPTYYSDDQNVKNIRRWRPECYINIWVVKSIPEPLSDTLIFPRPMVRTWTALSWKRAISARLTPTTS